MSGCCLCGGSQRRRVSPFAELYRCAGCGLIEHLRASSVAEEEARYQDVVFDTPLPVAQQQLGWLQSAWRNGPADLLDVGCGSGSFLVQARAAGWNVAGVEISPAAADRARQRLGATSAVLTGRIQDCVAGLGSYDVITLWDVLDHLEEPVRSLSDLSKLLQPGGLLLARVRNGPVHLLLHQLERRLERWLSGGGRRARWSVIHRAGYGIPQLRRLFQLAGLADFQIGATTLTQAPSDRALGAGRWLASLKKALEPACSVLGRWSGYRLYPSTSILVYARACPGESAPVA